MMWALRRDVILTRIFATSKTTCLTRVVSSIFPSMLYLVSLQQKERYRRFLEHFYDPIKQCQ